MSYNGSGVYTLPGAQLANGAVVSASENNQFRNDVAAALNVAWTRDGQAPAIANIPMANFKLTGLAAGATDGDSVRYEQVTSAVAITGGTINSTPIGGTTPSTGAFTTLSASSTVSGAGFTAYMASPPAIGGTAAAAGTFTTLNSTTSKATSYQETKTTVSASNIDLSTGNYFSKTISGTTTFTVSNVPTTGTAASFIFDITNGGSATITWFSGVKWPGGTAPTLMASGRDVLGFFTYDGGTTWSAFVLGEDLK